MIYCVYHNVDYDGICSAHIVNCLFDCKLIGMNYGDDFPINPEADDTVIMVDFSLQPFDRMVELNEKCKLIWIDHHISAIKEYEKSGCTIDGLRLTEIAACKLVWLYFVSDAPVPDFIRHLSDYDIWEHENEDVIYLQYGLKCAGINSPDDKKWHELYNNNTLRRYINNGYVAYQYDKNYKEECAKSAYEIDFHGYRAIVINQKNTNSKIFDSVFDADRHDIQIIYSYDGKHHEWHVGIYTPKDDIDVSKIAKVYGGGGHKGASGFSIDNIDILLG